MNPADQYTDNARTTAMLMESGIALMRENLRRRHPSANEAQLDALMESWLYRQDASIPGDTAGPVRVRRQGA